MGEAVTEVNEYVRRAFHLYQLIHYTSVAKLLVTSLSLICIIILAVDEFIA